MDFRLKAVVIMTYDCPGVKPLLKILTHLKMSGTTQSANQQLFIKKSSMYKNLGGVGVERNLRTKKYDVNLWRSGRLIP